MIDRISIRGLKSIYEMEIICKNLNLVVGVNSSGKSTFLQSILLFAQNEGKKASLNGKYISLGEWREVLNHYMGSEDSVCIKIWGDGKKEGSILTLKENGDSGECEGNVDIQGLSDEEIENEIFFGGSDSPVGYCIDTECLFYLSCQRIGAQDIYEKNIQRRELFGRKGEYALSFLLDNIDMPVDSDIESSGGKTNGLLDQVNYWLEYIIGATAHIDDIRKTNYLKVSYNNNPQSVNYDTQYKRPINIGSGISYLISILIVCLGAPKGAIILIENPEIHLHPKAQSRLCKFLYCVAQSGRQLFVETHSDHIFNGLRAGIADGSMSGDAIAINFFALDEQYRTQCNQLSIGEYGDVDGTNPNMDLTDLFDQFDIDIERMLYGRA